MTIVLSGLVTHVESNTPLADVRVYAQGGRGRRLAEARTDGTGAYQLEIPDREARAITGSGQSVVILADPRAVEAGEQRVWQPGEAQGGLDLRVRPRPRGWWSLSRAPRPVEPSEPNARVGGIEPSIPGADREPQSRLDELHGVVVNRLGAPAPHVTVTAIGRRVGRESLLQTTITDLDGRFTLDAIPSSRVPRALFVRAESEGQVLGESRWMTEAEAVKDSITIRIDKEWNSPSEFARVERDLGPELAGVDLATLRSEDVALLKQQTSEDLQAVGAYLAARAMSSRLEVDPETLYAILRVGRTGELPRLAAAGAEKLERGVQRAEKRGLVSRAAAERAAAVARTLVQEGAKRSADPKRSVVGRLLAVTTASEAQRVAFAKRFLTARSGTTNFWNDVGAELGAEVAGDIRLTLEVGELAEGHAPLVELLKKQGLTHARDLAGKSLDDWVELLESDAGRGAGVPQHIDGDSEDDRRRSFAQLLFTKARAAFPTTAVREAVRDAALEGPVADFLDRNPTFDVRASPVDSFLESADVDPAWNVVELSRDLRTVQRLALLAPPDRMPEVVRGLVELDLHSAARVAGLGRTSFLHRTAGVLDSVTAATVHRNATENLKHLMMVWASRHPNLRRQIVRSAQVEASEARVAGSEADVTWESLFGRLSHCRCEHCNSVFSPAAYLVDLLSWLGGIQAQGKNAFEVFDARRPDVKRILLSCENTNTVMPYVDLVLEILEASVLDDPQLIPDGTTHTTEELLAKAEHQQVKVYGEGLRNAVFPISLPFDLWFETASVFLTHLGARRHELAEALDPDGASVNDGVAADRLGMAPALWDVLVGSGVDDVGALWALGPAMSRESLVVDNFLRRAGITYEELLDLLHTRFVGGLGITIEGDRCDTKAMTLSGQAMDEGLLRSSKFIRLWRNRGGSMLELDKLLHALGAQDTDAAVLRSLADVDRLQQLTKASLLDVAAWFSDLDTFPDRDGRADPALPLYDDRFLDKRLGPDHPSPFVVFSQLAEPTGVPILDPKLSVHREHLQAALGIESDDLARLIDETRNGLPNPDRVILDDELTLANLSKIYRHVTLAEALRLRVGDLLALIRVVGTDPFQNTASAVNFVRLARWLDASPLGVDDIAYLLEHDLESAERVGLSDAEVSTFLVGLRDGLTALELELGIDEDPTGAATARLLERVMDGATADALVGLLRVEPTTAFDQASFSAVWGAQVEPALGAPAPVLQRPGMTSSDRLRQVSEMVVAHLRTIRGRALVQTMASTFLDLTPDATEDLLLRRFTLQNRPAIDGLRTSPFTVTSEAGLERMQDSDAFDLIHRLWKVRVLLDALQMDTRAQRWWFESGIPHGFVDPRTLPLSPKSSSHTWDSFITLVRVFTLEEELPGRRPDLVDLLNTLTFQSEGPPRSFDGLLEQVSRLTGMQEAASRAVAEDNGITALSAWPLPPAEHARLFRACFFYRIAARTQWSTEDLEELAAEVGTTFPDDYWDGQALTRLTRAMGLVRRTGASAAKVLDWAKHPIDKARSEAIEKAAKARHDHTSWSDIATRLRNPIRNRQRDALTGWLIAHRSYRNVHHLYEHLLVDAEMDACMKTSRVKLALSSIQLFVHRAMLGLEPEVALSKDDREEWEWRKNYRVWEAAIKVLLYPENWLEPELRTDKSPFFVEFENALLQGELTDEVVQGAYTDYLTKLDEVSRLEAMSVWHERGHEGRDLIHVVGRTRALPHRYFYRQWRNQRRWAPWEPIEAAIESNHAVLLYCVWPDPPGLANHHGVSTSGIRRP